MLVLIIVFSLLVSSFVFISCDKKEETPKADFHDHTYSETHHYHKATCEHSEEKGSYEEHTYVNHVCSECGKVNETTLFSLLKSIVNSQYLEVTGSRTLESKE